MLKSEECTLEKTENGFILRMGWLADDGTPQESSRVYEMPDAMFIPGADDDAMRSALKDVFEEIIAFYALGRNMGPGKSYLSIEQVIIEEKKVAS